MASVGLAAKTLPSRWVCKDPQNLRLAAGRRWHEGSFVVSHDDAVEFVTNRRNHVHRPRCLVQKHVWMIPVGAGSEPAPTNYEHSHQTNVALPRVGAGSKPAQ
jgi:hypothetical protein